MLRPCLDCGEPTPSPRCPLHTKEKEAGRPSRRAKGRYDSRWVKLRQIALRSHPWCTQCGGTTDLTVDHIVPLAMGGRTVLSNMQVLCRADNSAKRDRVAT